MRTILIVDDEPAARYGMRRALEGSYQIVEAGSASAAREAVAKQSFDLILLDLIMPGEDGLAFLRSLRAGGDATPVLIVSALDTARTAVEALHSGAADYIVKGFDIEELRKRVANLVRLGELGAENERLRRELVAEGQFGRMLGSSAAMRRVFEMADRVAPTDATVLILGESGTGKELLAQEIHARSPRAEKAVRGRKLRGAAGKSDRIGVFRLRARRVHGCRAAAQGKIRAGVRRHAFSRRNRRHESGDAGESAARARKPEDRAARRVAFDRRGCARHQRDGFCRPARTVSGNYYDFLTLNSGKMILAVGDISGKGISSALIDHIHSAVRAYSIEGIPLLRASAM